MRVRPPVAKLCLGTRGAYTCRSPSAGVQHNAGIYHWETIAEEQLLLAEHGNMNLIIISIMSALSQ